MHAAPDQPGRDISAGQHAEDAAQEGQRCHPADLLEAEAPAGLQVAGQPGQVDPHGVEHAERADDHEPGVRLPEQGEPAGLLGSTSSAFGVGLVSASAPLISISSREGGVTVDLDPDSGDDQAEARRRSRNMPCQLMVSSRNVSSGGAIALAICDPVLMIEIGRERSSLANHRCGDLQTGGEERRFGDAERRPASRRTAGNDGRAR